MSRGATLLVLGLLATGSGGAVAQNEAARAFSGVWEFSNADRSRVCTITFRTDPAATGMKLEFDRICLGTFPFVREIAGWTMAEGDFLRLLDAAGKSVLDFSEVESGVYEAPRPGEGILFIQKAGGVGPVQPTAREMSGEWNVVRGGGRPICTLALSNSGTGALAVQVKPPCDGFVTRFGPVAWQMEGGELVLKSARGQAWRFEASEEPATWRRVPASADPVLLVRK